MLNALSSLFGRNEGESLERALLQIARDVWEVERLGREGQYPLFEHPTAWPADEYDDRMADRERRVAESFRRLLAQYAEPDLTRRAAEMYFEPAWYLRYRWNPSLAMDMLWLLHGQARILSYLLHRWLAQHPPDDLANRLRLRLEYLFGDPRPHGVRAHDDPYCYEPEMAACLDLLSYATGEQSLALIYNLLTGRIVVQPDPDPSADADRKKSYFVYGSELQKATPLMLERLWQANRFDQALLDEVCRLQQFLLSYLVLGRLDNGRAAFYYQQVKPEFAKLLETTAQAVLRDWVEHLDASNAELLCNVRQLTGSWYLLKACEHIERLGLKRLGSMDYNHRGEVPSAVTRLCRVLYGSEEPAEVVKALRAFGEKTLLLVLPASVQYGDLICQALGWDGARELVQLLHQCVHIQPDTVVPDLKLANSTDLTLGVFDANQLRCVRERLGEQRFSVLLKSFRTLPGSVSNALFLFDAATGSNRTEVLDKFAKRNQLAVRALSLLPIEHPDETVRRYAALRQFAKEALKFGMQRQNTELAAVQAGLTNLALNAGYPDTTRLEWAMEDRLGTGIGVGGREWKIDDQYSVQLQVGAKGPELTAYKDGRALKSLPAVVKGHAEYTAMKAIKAELQAQARRYRAALEDVMCRGDELGPDELAVLARNPSAFHMLSALILLDRASHVGLLHPESNQLEEYDGTQDPVACPVRIAHPVDLDARRLLSSWQRQVVRRRIVQPFKQAFRELYVVTPAELETRTFSRRYGGQVVASKQAARLLQAKGWDCVGEDWPRKVFHRAGLTAFLSFVETYHFMGELETLVTDEVCFLPSNVPAWWGPRYDPRLPLAEIPPLIFSEVMRDVDLIVSVALSSPQAAAPQPVQGEPLQASPAVIERRADLVREFASDLGLKNVSVEGNFAHIRGQLATYRLHLGSATIHLEPGAYLCVVPARWGSRHERLFLPFEAEDEKTSEVVSKVLLLAEDHKIKDQSILRQIRRGTTAA